MAIKTFDMALAEVERMVDRLGMHVDPGIRRTVAGLMMNNIPTSASCEGHLDRAVPYPWVDIGVAEEIHEDPAPLTGKLKTIQDDLERLAVGNQVYLYNTVVSTEDNRRYAIHINEQGTNGWEFKVRSESKAKLEKRILRQKLLELLEQFYVSKKSAYMNTLVLGSNMRLLSVGAIGLEGEDEKSKRKWLEEFQGEMTAFGEFLIAYGSIDVNQEGV